jgi:hypothetical protein
MIVTYSKKNFEDENPLASGQSFFFTLVAIRAEAV